MSYAIPKNIVMKRGSGDSVEATWGYTGGTRFDTSVETDWYFNASKDMSDTVIEQIGSGSATGDIVWNRPTSSSGGNLPSSDSCQYNRQKYHPLTSGRYLQSVKLLVANGVYGGRWYEDYIERAATLTFGKPRKPTISGPEYDTNNGNVSFTVTTDAGTDKYERYDTMYRILRQDSANRGNKYKDETVVVSWKSSTDTSIDATYTLKEGRENALPAGEWVKITCQAYARGLAGDSQTASVSYVYGRPAKASITSIVVDKLDNDIDTTGIVTVRLKTNATEESPVDTVKLQRLPDSDLTNSTDASLAQGWADVENAVDDGTCSGLSDTVYAAMPAVGKHKWYRLATTHGNYTQYSVPVEAKCLYRAKSPAQAAKAKFVRLEPMGDGVSVIARICWKSTDGKNATQISWSQHEDAWESTEQPQTCDITWEDSSSSGLPTGWDKSATITIRGLEEQSACYVRARRGTTGEDESWDAWCYPDSKLYPVFTASTPEDVVLNVPAVIQRGDGIDCSWTFSGSEQTQWQIVYLDSNGKEKVLVQGAGAAGATTVPASKVKRMSSVKLAVKVTCGGDWASSDYLPVSIEDAPTLTLASISTLTAQPLAITMTSTMARCNATIYVTSHGVTTETPAESDVQADGDVVWAEVVSPRWEAVYAKTTDTEIVTGKDYYTKSGNVYTKVETPQAGNLSSYYEITSYTATVTAPIIKLHEGATYDVTASLTDTKTLLSSAWKTRMFTVSWAHRAVEPGTTTTVVANPADLSAVITAGVPNRTGAYAQGDSYSQYDLVDVYRTTPDGNYLIASDVPFGTSVVDRYAPYSWRSDLAYTLCTKTRDGDLAWSEYPYELPHKLLRFDFGGNHVEFPYNIVTSDSWEKSSEIREHLDGTRAGYWNMGATRKASLSTDLVRLKSAEDRRLVGELAKYSGPCLVRTPGGCVYTANVDVEGYEDSYDSAKAGVSFSATEVAITDEYKISPNDWLFESGVSA